MKINEDRLRQLQDLGLVSVYRRGKRKVIVPRLKTKGLVEEQNFPLVRMIIYEDGNYSFQFSGEVTSSSIVDSSFLLDLCDKLEIVHSFLNTPYHKTRLDQ